jgi:tetratricopeptide (TPR) repeat protein
MTYQEDEKVRIRRRDSQQAISLAMQGRWREAIAANLNLLENFANDVDAYNRLGRAYMELGEYSQARGAYSRALALDPYNIISKKNLDRLSRLGETALGSGSTFHKVEPHGFIEETGKAGVVRLHRLAPDSVLAGVVAGDRLELKITGLNLAVSNSRDEYLGQVELRHAQRLIRLMNGGNRYSASVVGVAEGMVTIIIREVYQDPAQVGLLSFPPKNLESIRPYTSDRTLRREEEELEEEPEYAGGSDEVSELSSEESPRLGDKIDGDG